MGAALDKVPAEFDAQCLAPTNYLTLSEILYQAHGFSSTPSSQTSDPIWIQLNDLYDLLTEKPNLTYTEVKTNMKSLKVLKHSPKTSEEEKLFNQVSDMFFQSLERAKTDSEYQSEVSSDIRQTFDDLFERLQQGMSVKKVLEEFDPLNLLYFLTDVPEDKKSLFEARMALIRTLKTAVTPKGVSEILNHEIALQVKIHALACDQQLSTTFGPNAAMFFHDRRIPLALKEVEAFLTEVPAQAEPQIDPKVIVSYLEQKLQSRESEIEALNVKLSEQFEKNKKTISSLIEDLKTSQGKKEQLNTDYIKLIRYHESNQAQKALEISQSQVQELTLKVQNAERLVEEMKIKLSTEEKENCKLKDEIINLEVLNQQLKNTKESYASTIASFKNDLREKDNYYQELLKDSDFKTELKSDEIRKLRLIMKSVELGELELRAEKHALALQYTELKKFSESVQKEAASTVQQLILDVERAGSLAKRTEEKLIGKSVTIVKLEEAIKKLTTRNEELEKSQISDQATMDELISDLRQSQEEYMATMSEAELKTREFESRAEEAENLVREMRKQIMEGNEKNRKLAEENQKLAEENEGLEKSRKSTQTTMDRLRIDVRQVTEDYSLLQREAHSKIQELSGKVREAVNVADKMNDQMMDESEKNRKLNEENQKLTEENEKLEKIRESNVLKLANWEAEFSQLEKRFALESTCTEQKIDSLKQEVYFSGEKVKDLKNEIAIGTEKNRKLIEINEDLERDYAHLEESKNSIVANLEDRLRKTNEALSMEQDKLEHAEMSIECLRKADIELSKDLRQCAMEKEESEKKLKAELEEVRKDLEMCQLDVVWARVQKEELMVKAKAEIKELKEKYEEKSRLLAGLQMEKEEKQMEKDELEEQGYELYEL